MGLDVYLQRNGKGDETASTIDPEHLFKRGYFRSSYNGSGFDSVMRRTGCPELAAIFGARENQSRFTPDWQVSLTRAQIALEQYREHLASPAGGHYVGWIGAKDGGVSSEHEALMAYVQEVSREKLPFTAYSNKVGHFWIDGAKLKAAIPGQQPWGANGVFLVFEYERQEGERDSYETALLIVIETIEYVLASGAPDEFSLYWSA